MSDVSATIVGRNIILSCKVRFDEDDDWDLVEDLCDIRSVKSVDINGHVVTLKASKSSTDERRGQIRDEAIRIIREYQEERSDDGDDDDSVVDLLLDIASAAWDIFKPFG